MNKAKAMELAGDDLPCVVVDGAEGIYLTRVGGSVQLVPVRVVDMAPKPKAAKAKGQPKAGGDAA